MGVYTLTVGSRLSVRLLIRLSRSHLRIERLPWLRPWPISAISLVEGLWLLWLAWSLACCSALVITSLLVVLIGHLLIVGTSLRVRFALILLRVEIIGVRPVLHHSLLLTACLMAIIYIVASLGVAVVSYLRVWLEVGSAHPALAHLLNYSLHELTGILKTLELLGKLLVEWAEREFLLTRAFWHRLQSSEQVVRHIV